MSIEQDLADIDSAILAQRIGHLAASARAASAQLAECSEQPPQHHSAAGDMLVAQGMRRVPAPTGRIDSWLAPWYRRRSTLIAAGVAAFVAVAGLVVWAVVGVVSATTAAVTAHSGSIEGFAVLGAVVLLCLMFSGRRGGGKDFSGTFTGRVH